jgi:iron complex transport system substrate-binding protein
VAALLAAASLTLSGCGSSEAEAGGPRRTVTDGTGAQVKVPESPRRVLALGETELDGLLSLGVTPVGTIQGRGQAGAPAYLADKVPGIALVGTVSAADIEKVAAARPDLIVVGAATATAKDDKQLARLRDLAPVFVSSRTGADNAQEDWRTILGRVADAVNKKDAVASVVAAYEAKVAEVRKAIGENAGTSASVVRWNANGPGYMLDDNAAVRVLKDLGFTRVPGQRQPGSGHSEPLSLENVDRIDADWLFLGTLNPDGEKALRQARTNKAYAALKAVRNDHVVTVDGTLWTAGAAGPTALTMILDTVAGELAGR